jgi:hypothetical protein
MFKKFLENQKAKLEKKQEEVKKQNELKKAQSYYNLIKAGNAFIQFVQEDMKKNKDEVNRAMRRRQEKELNEKGVLSPELVEYYRQKIDYVLGNIYIRLNPAKVQPQNKDGMQIRNTKPEGVNIVEAGKIIPPQGGTGECKVAS